MNNRRGRVAYAFLAVGVVLNALALTGTRFMGQRVLYAAAGVLFIVAAIVRLREARNAPPD